MRLFPACISCGTLNFWVGNYLADEEQAGPSRQTRRRDSHMTSGAMGRREDESSAGNAHSRFPSRLRQVVSRYSPEADSAVPSERRSKRHDRNHDRSARPDFHSAPANSARWGLRSREAPVTRGVLGQAAASAARAGSSSAGAPVVRLRVSSRLQGLEQPPMGQLLRSQQAAQPQPAQLPPPAAGDGPARPPRRAAAAAAQQHLAEPSTSPEPESRPQRAISRRSLRGWWERSSLAPSQDAAPTRQENDDASNPRAQGAAEARASYEASPARSLRRRALSSTPPAAARGASSAALSNGDVAANPGQSRRQSRRTAGFQVSNEDHTEEELEEEEDDVRRGSSRRRQGRKGRQRTLGELHRAENGPSEPAFDLDGPGAENMLEAQRRFGSGLRFRITRNGVSL